MYEMRTVTRLKEVNHPMRIYADMFQMAEDKNTGKWYNDCTGCKQTAGANCEPVSKKYPLGKCPGFTEG